MVSDGVWALAFLAVGWAQYTDPFPAAVAAVVAGFLGWGLLEYPTRRAATIDPLEALRDPGQDPAHGLKASDLSAGSLTGPFAKIRVVTPGYFKTLGIPMLAGRDFSEEDLRERREPVFIVNEAFASKYLLTGDVLSARISVLGRPDNPYARVIGVAGDVYDQSPRLGAAPTVFYAHAHQPISGMVLLVRIDATADLGQAVVQTVRDLDKNQVVSQVRLLSDALRTSAGFERSAALASSGVALTALLLASLGVYGLLAYLVVERTREIGIRMALGAQTSTVVGMVMARGLRLIAYGGVLGLAGGLALSQLIRGLLYGVTPIDLPTLTGVIVFVGIVGTLAAFVSARRAARVDPADRSATGIVRPGVCGAGGAPIWCRSYARVRNSDRGGPSSLLPRHHRWAFAYPQFPSLPAAQECVGIGLGGHRPVTQHSATRQAYAPDTFCGP